MQSPSSPRAAASRAPKTGPSAAQADKDSPEQSSLFVNSVEKAMRVLMVFSARRRQLSLSQISSMTGLDMSAAQRFTFTLLHLKLLRKDPESKLYELSPRMLDFGYQYTASNELVSRATPFLQQLSVETEETVNLTTLDGPEIVFLQRIVSRHVLTPEVIVGTRLPAYCTSSGLAILSALPPEEAAAVLDASELTKYTQHTVADREQILRRLEKIRALGYAHTEDEMYLGDIATAVPIVDSDDRPLGAINVAVARSRWKGAEDEQRISSLLMAAGRAISSRG
ncbi:MAG: IclR family transcriptional regulator [Xenophilus sp.]